MSHLWDYIVETLMALTMPMLCCYYTLCQDPFLNVAITPAPPLEHVANITLTPLRYLCAGKIASQNPDATWTLAQEFTYQEGLWWKTPISLLSLPLALPAGILLKTCSHTLSLPAKQTFAQLCTFQKSTHITPNLPLYESLGLTLQSPETYPSEGHQRRPGDENHLAASKKALQAITTLLNQAHIPWWVDCGTLLGTHRYGGVIPWDEDIDIAVLLPDFHNIRHVLNNLDPTQYMVQDWSGRDFPDTLLKVYAKETGDWIDLYFYDIHPEKKEIQFLFSLDQNLFFFEWFKIRERRFTVPIALDSVFPLKKALFDGLEVFVPNKPVPFLQRYYGENLQPAKVYDPSTGRFEKDLTHPYWQNAYVH